MRIILQYFFYKLVRRIHTEDRIIYIPETFGVNYDLYLPKTWIREVYEF